ncbi:type II toxin-antitoxin system HicB family antitoxin [Methylobacterium sp. 37f]|uniref:type II toxin-antitoxin system HicB family antitoxin n=1 Tax=Methylobacterium sp. 37f TaxID=2817058 RepID=UPI001FFC423D|nr:type II toxin-antitoxin system HicB family antitoxin [Methylobacterium sp. 37f]MCK2057201.1 type II toxin-antitoxin system HicB family antitoxin [Methylobacterium sp. 37f]
MLIYPIHLTPDDNDTFLVTSPVFPEFTTFAETREEAIVNARKAFEEAVGARISAGEAIPAPFKPDLEQKMDAADAAAVRLSALTSLKAGLYQAMRVAGVTRAELARRLNWKRESVDRLFRLDHRSRLDQIEAAFNAIGEEVSVGHRKFG